MSTTADRRALRAAIKEFVTTRGSITIYDKTAFGCAATVLRNQLELLESEGVFHAQRVGKRKVWALVGVPIEGGKEIKPRTSRALPMLPTDGPCLEPGDGERLVCVNEGPCIDAFLARYPRAVHGRCPVGCKWYHPLKIEAENRAEGALSWVR